VSTQVAVMPLAALTLAPTASSTFLAAGSFCAASDEANPSKIKIPVYIFFISFFLMAAKIGFAAG
jgi:hypothetical protein